MLVESSEGDDGIKYFKVRAFKPNDACHTAYCDIAKDGRVLWVIRDDINNGGYVIGTFNEGSSFGDPSEFYL